jgi:hypothetical protein
MHRGNTALTFPSNLWVVRVGFNPRLYLVIFFQIYALNEANFAYVNEPHKTKMFLETLKGRNWNNNDKKLIRHGTFSNNRQML